MSRGLQSKLFGDDVSRGMRDLATRMRAHRKETTLAILGVLQAQIVEELSTPGRGKDRRAKLTTRSGKRKTGKARANALARAGKASAPGDPPAPDTGKLRGSIQIEYDDASRKGRVGTNTAYAAALNFGTTTAGKGRNVVILPRPFMEPALKKAAVAMTAAGAKEINLTVRTRAR